MIPTVQVLIAVVCALATVGAALDAGAAPPKLSPDQRCRKARFDAAGAYAQCHQKMMGRFIAGLGPDLDKCRVKYAATWAKLRKQFADTGTTCALERFAMDTLTVRDELTSLTWQRQTDDGGIQDKDNYYELTAGGLGSPYEDGPVFTSFLAQINTPPCFARFCDWRLPTLAEIATIMAAPPCTAPCIDESLFGPSAGPPLWTATALMDLPTSHWMVGFSTDEIGVGELHHYGYVRAVRGGL